MPVDDELAVIVGMVNSVEQPAAADAGVAGLRDGFALLAGMFGGGADGVHVEDLVAHLEHRDLPLRLYRPADVQDAGTVSGALVWLHGGGWVIGSIATHDALCRDLAAASDCVVVSVEYRLAPEHPHPAALHDTLDAFRWVVDHAAQLGLDADSVALGGDSAGANLATVAARLLRDGGGVTPVLQVLVYPVTDLSGDTGRHPSLVENGTGLVLTAETMGFFADCYAPDRATRLLPEVSPLRCTALAGLAPALVLTAGYDPLRDEGLAYADALEAAGVPTERRHHATGVHMFVQWRTTELGRRAVREVAEVLVERLTPDR